LNIFQKPLKFQKYKINLLPSHSANKKAPNNNISRIS
jgi:hypothetical protein